MTSSSDVSSSSPRSGPSIWWWAFGYFACYVPYTMLTKMVSSKAPLVDVGTPEGVPGLELLPPTALASVVTAYVFLFGSGLGRHATRPVGGVRLPLPSRMTFLSGLCAAGIIATTTLAYTFKASPMLLALLMRGGVLVLAPVVDKLFRRKVRWFSWAALGLSLLGLLVTLQDGNTTMTRIAILDVLFYLGFYFARLSIMSSKAKSKDPGANRRYFVEEMLVSTPALVILLGLGALVLGGRQGDQLSAGFTSFFERPIVLHAIAIGVLSQGTGIFGGLVFLDPRENTFCVPVNRASSVLAVLLASLMLALSYASYPTPPGQELLSALLILVAIGFLTLGPQLEPRRR